MSKFKTVFDKDAHQQRQRQHQTGKSHSRSIDRAKAYVESKAFPAPSARKAPRILKRSNNPLVIGGKVCNL